MREPMTFLSILGLQLTLTWAGSDTEVTNFVASNKRHNGFSKFLHPNDKLSNLDEMKITDDKTVNEWKILEELLQAIIEQPKEVSADVRASLLHAIFPGTKWCGAGDIARNQEDLGLFDYTDECCREHDNCPDNIISFGSKHGLTNNALFTKSNCDCDDKFYSCLKTANTAITLVIGLTYFNLWRPKCYKKEHPIISCEEETGDIFKRCKQYNLNLTAPKVWQWFDAKQY